MNLPVKAQGTADKGSRFYLVLSGFICSSLFCSSGALTPAASLKCSFFPLGSSHSACGRPRASLRAPPAAGAVRGAEGTRGESMWWYNYSLLYSIGIGIGIIGSGIGTLILVLLV